MKTKQIELITFLNSLNFDYLGDAEIFNYYIITKHDDSNFLIKEKNDIIKYIILLENYSQSFNGFDSVHFFNEFEKHQLKEKLLNELKSSNVKQIKQIKI